MPMGVPEYDVVVVGAGFGGMGAAIQLKKMGYDNILIVDRLFAAAELRLGAEDQQRVRIIRTDGVRRGPLQRMRSSGGASQATNARIHSGGQR